jgi:hypothetical protein
VAGLDRAPHLPRGDQGGGVVNRWTEDDSKDLDQQVRAIRRAERTERSPAALAKTQADRARRAKTETDTIKEGK